MNAVAGSADIVIMGLTILATITFILVCFILSRYKVVENNELLIVESWFLRKRPLRFVSGGTTFVFPFFEKFFMHSLEPMELTIDLNRVMTKGNIPLGGKIFAQVVIDDTEPHVYNVATHLANRNRAKQIECIMEILNGVLRETVANLTPEQVLEDKETFKEEMLKNAVVSLGHLGFKIKTLNIQEVSDEVNDGTGYIAQLMRPRIYYVNRDTRIEVSDAEARKTIEQNEAHKAMRLTQLEQELQSIEAEMNYQIEQKVAEGDVQAEEIKADLDAQYQEMLASLETKKAELQAMISRYEADHIQKASARKEQLVEEGKASAATIRHAGEAEVKVLRKQLSILERSGSEGLEAFLIDNYSQLSRIFTDTMENAHTRELNIIEGLSGNGSGSGHPLSPQNTAVLIEILKNSGLDVSRIVPAIKNGKAAGAAPAKVEPPAPPKPS
jgi:uncharacterized membrane protein YqiK